MGTATEEPATERQATRCVKGWLALGLRDPLCPLLNQPFNRVGLLDASSAYAVAGTLAASAGSNNGLEKPGCDSWRQSLSVFLNTPCIVV